MSALTLDQASIIVDKALEKGRNWAPTRRSWCSAGGQLRR
jgi:hypothetical protein